MRVRERQGEGGLKNNKKRGTYRRASDIRGLNCESGENAVYSRLIS